MKRNDVNAPTGDNKTRTAVHGLLDGKFSQPDQVDMRDFITPEYVVANLDRMGEGYNRLLARVEHRDITKEWKLPLKDGSLHPFEDWDVIAERIRSNPDLQRKIAALVTNSECLPFVCPDLSGASVGHVTGAIKREYPKMECDFRPEGRMQSFGASSGPNVEEGQKIGCVFIDNGDQVPQETLELSAHQLDAIFASQGYTMTSVNNRAMMRLGLDKDVNCLLGETTSGGWLFYSQSSPSTELRFGTTEPKTPGNRFSGARRQLRVNADS